MIEEIFLAFHNEQIEIIVGDNGSVDRSVEIATTSGARVVSIKTRGYGAAIRGAASVARGEYVVFGDSDGTYCFGDAKEMIAKLDQGADLVIGNRYRGGIADEAMPKLNRYLGTPLLSLTFGLLYGIRVRDINCGLRAIRRSSLLNLECTAPGMEFASELMVRARHNNLVIVETPASLHVGPPGRRPHLRPWRDGLRHALVLLAFSSRTSWYLFITTAIVPLAVLTVLTIRGQVSVGEAQLSFRSSVMLAVLFVVGTQTAILSVICRLHLSPTVLTHEFWARRLLPFGSVLVAGGILLFALELTFWLRQGFDRAAPGVGVIRTVLAGGLMMTGVICITGALVMALFRDSRNRILSQ